MMSVMWQHLANAIARSCIYWYICKYVCLASP